MHLFSLSHLKNQFWEAHLGGPQRVAPKRLFLKCQLAWPEFINSHFGTVAGAPGSENCA